MSRDFFFFRRNGCLQVQVRTPHVEYRSAP
jgi:hypothetical protein